MKLKSLSLACSFVLLVVAAACEKKSPTAPAEIAAGAPAESAVTDAKTGATIGAPQPVSPAANQQFKNVQQPVTLSISNGVTTATAGLTYTFEVATDSAFASKVYTKDVAEGSNGQTTLTIDKLGPSKVYYWRARSNSGGVVGPNSASRGFEIGPEVILQTPALASPTQNQTVVGTGLSLVVNNVGRTGPAGPVFYRFEASDSASFGTILLATTVEESGGSQTSLSVPTTGLTSGATYFWRVIATDPENAVTSPTSGVFGFTYIRFSLNITTALDFGLDDFTKWPETTMITALDMGPFGINVEFGKKHGPDRWPDIIPPGFAGPIQYCLGMAWLIDGRWYSSAPIEMWNERAEGGGPPHEYSLNWFYNPARWAPMTFYQPSPGETIGFFVTAGDTRGFNSHSKVQERSNVVLVPMPGSGGASYRFNADGSLIR